MRGRFVKAVLLGAIGSVAAASLAGLALERPGPDRAAQALTTPALRGSEVVVATAVPAETRRPRSSVRPAADLRPAPVVVVVVEPGSVVLAAGAATRTAPVRKGAQPRKPETPGGRLLANDATADPPSERPNRPRRINE